MKSPKKDLPVLAKIEKRGSDHGESWLEAWFEVVWYNNNFLNSNPSQWTSYAGSDTFANGEQVIDWV